MERLPEKLPNFSGTPVEQLFRNIRKTLNPLWIKRFLCESGRSFLYKNQAIYHRRSGLNAFLSGIFRKSGSNKKIKRKRGACKVS